MCFYQTFSVVSDGSIVFPIGPSLRYGDARTVPMSLTPYALPLTPDASLSIKAAAMYSRSSVVSSGNTGMAKVRLDKYSALGRSPGW